MRVFFLIQGEGRGHLTQALAMQELLRGKGIEVCGAVVGSNKHREVPEFFKQRMSPVNVTLLPSPNFVKWKNRGINLSGTAWQTITHLRRYRRSVKLLDTLIKSTQPDLIINFYEPLSALWKFIYRGKVPVVSIAHQYIMLHKRFTHPKGHWLDRQVLNGYTKFTAFRSSALLGLSFYPMSDDASKKLYTVPPLLRPEVMNQHPSRGNHFLVYMVNAGYLPDVVKWHEHHKGLEFHVFTDRRQEQETEMIHENLYVHKLSDVKFLRYMSTCSGLITTAGFESVCEAMYLGKPVFMIPVEYHFEQFCNSRDAHKAGAGIYSTKYDIDRFMKWLPSYTSRSGEFKEWASQADHLIGNHILRILHTHQQPASGMQQGAAKA
ncbi:MAG: glycosyl transferase [Bacteroidia bacterium]|jgi:uncharacterized protein (TIGR00661 family)|nr:glycosyl transferase [Bacteroidia bacterium]